MGLKVGDILRCRNSYVNRNNKNMKFIKNELYIIDDPNLYYHDRDCIGVSGKTYIIDRDDTCELELTIGFDEFDKYFETKNSRAKRIIDEFKSR